MKRDGFLAVVIILVLSAFTLKAQDKKVEFGIVAGYGHTMPKLKDSRSVKNPAISQNNLSGFHAGPVLKFNFSEQVALQTGLLFNYFSGVSINSSQLSLKKNLGTWYQDRNKLTAFDVPLRFMYSFPLADEFNLIIIAGPSLNYAYSKIVQTENFVDNKLTNKTQGLNIYQSPGNYSALDLQLGAGIGVQYMGVSLRGGYDWGLLNRTVLPDARLRSNDLKISLGYTF